MQALKRILKWTGIVIGALIVLAIILPKNNDKPAEPAAIAAKATSQPLAQQPISQPTNAVAKPTETPALPTPTSAPVATRTPTTSPQLITYISKVIPLMQDLNATLGEFADTATKTSGTVTAVQKAKMKAAASSASTQFMSLSVKWAFLSPTSETRAFHSCMVQSLDLLQQGASKIEFALIMDDTGDLRTAAEVVTAGIEQYQKCLDMSKSFTS